MYCVYIIYDYLACPHINIETILQVGYLPNKALLASYNCNIILCIVHWGSVFAETEAILIMYIMMHAKQQWLGIYEWILSYGVQYTCTRRLYIMTPYNHLIILKDNHYNTTILSESKYSNEI